MIFSRLESSNVFFLASLAGLVSATMETSATGVIVVPLVMLTLAVADVRGLGARALGLVLFLCWLAEGFDMCTGTSR